MNEVNDLFGRLRSMLHYTPIWSFTLDWAIIDLAVVSSCGGPESPVAIFTEKQVCEFFDPADSFRSSSITMYHNPPDRKSNNRQFVEAATQRKAANDTQYFWDLVQRHMNGHYVGPRRMPRHSEENFLFAKKAEQVSSGFIDDNIPVERSGPKSDEISTIESFAELGDKVPPNVMKCFELLRYEKPSPIQKHSIPLGLAGMDLVCCAQTVRRLMGDTPTTSLTLLIVSRFVGLGKDNGVLSSSCHAAGPCICSTDRRRGERARS